MGRVELTKEERKIWEQREKRAMRVAKRHWEEEEVQERVRLEEMWKNGNSL